MNAEAVFSGDSPWFQWIVALLAITLSAGVLLYGRRGRRATMSTVTFDRATCYVSGEGGGQHLVYGTFDAVREVFTARAESGQQTAYLSWEPGTRLPVFSHEDARIVDLVAKRVGEVVGREVEVG